MPTHLISIKEEREEAAPYLFLKTPSFLLSASSLRQLSASMDLTSSPAGAKVCPAVLFYLPYGIIR